MSSPTEEEEKIPADFIHCVQKLLSSVSTLSKHLSLLTVQKETKGPDEELTSKLQVRQIYIFIGFKEIISINLNYQTYID
jgi:hypothetical protein